MEEALIFKGITVIRNPHLERVRAVKVSPNSAHVSHLIYGIVFLETTKGDYGKLLSRFGTTDETIESCTEYIKIQIKNSIENSYLNWIIKDNY